MSVLYCNKGQRTEEEQSHQLARFCLAISGLLFNDDWEEIEADILFRTNSILMRGYQSFYYSVVGIKEQ